MSTIEGHSLVMCACVPRLPCQRARRLARAFALLGALVSLSSAVGCTASESKLRPPEDASLQPGVNPNPSDVASTERDGGAVASTVDAAASGPSDPMRADAEVDQADGATQDPGAQVGGDYVFTPCGDEGPECPCPRGERWPWPAFMPEPTTSSLYCTPDGRVASPSVSPSERIPVTCASVCLAFSLASEEGEYHGLCDQFGNDSKLCIEECTREWTPEEICCRAERVSSQKPGVSDVGQYGVPGFPSCGSDAVNSHYACQQIRRPEDPFFLERYAACGAMGGRRY